MCRELGVISSAVAGCDGRLLSPKTAWSCTTRPLIGSEMCASVDGCSPKSGRSMQGIRLSKNISALSWLEHLLEWMVPNQASCLHACFVGFRMVPVVALASCSAGTDVRRKQEPEVICDRELITMPLLSMRTRISSEAPSQRPLP